MSDCVTLPVQSIAAITEPPAMEWWQEAMRKSTESEALRLRQHAIGNLSNFPGWSPLVAEAEEILRERGIGY
jgi:hypothetical protein